MTKLQSTFVFLCLLATIPGGCTSEKKTESDSGPQPGADGAFHVRPGDDLQAVIDAAGRNPEHKTVLVHEGTYRPDRPGQAFIYLNRNHDGVKLKAVGKVILTARNPDKAIVTSPTFPAIVNHVVYFGNGISNRTSIDGFEITGAKACLLQDGVESIEPDLPESLAPKLFFFSDGGAIKIYGDSCPQLLNLLIRDNEVAVCGGGVSVDQREACDSPVLIRNCVFTNNRCPATGSALDVLQGSRARIENCLFVENVGNYGMDEIARVYRLSYNDRHGSGALTVFPKSSVEVISCTFTKNWNGVDDKGKGSRYENCIFWKNDNWDQSRPGEPYEMDVNQETVVKNCFLSGRVEDLQNTIDRKANHFIDDDPLFDDRFVPQSETYRNVGYRPAPPLE